MATEVLIFQQFLIVVGHSNQVELDDTIVEVNPRRVHIPKYKSLLMNVEDPRAQLPEN